MSRSPQAALKGKVGPNAVIQLGQALRERAGNEIAARVFERAGYRELLDRPPSEMIDEQVPAALFDALWRLLPGDQAEAVARDAGRRTAEYVIANRIPRLAALLIRILPRSYGRRLLLNAIRRNAWTFAGSGECGILPHAGGISIAGNPLSMPGGIWHVGVLETMFRELVASVTIRHVAIIRDTIREDRFEIA